MAVVRPNVPRIRSTQRALEPGIFGPVTERKMMDMIELLDYEPGTTYSGVLYVELSTNKSKLCRCLLAAPAGAQRRGHERGVCMDEYVLHTA